MAPENNSDLNQDSVSKTDEPTKPISDISTNPTSPGSSSVSSDSVSSETSSNDISSTDSASPDASSSSTPSLSASPSGASGPTVSDDSIADAMAHMDKTETTNSVVDNSSSPKGKGMLKVLLVLIVAILVIGGVAALAYHEGKGKQKIVYATPPVKPISLPPTAIVTENCVPGRGKQYVIPKDIPQGPIYDVENSKVIAIEYLISVQELLSNSSSFSSSFSSIILSLSKNYPVDHFSLVPAPPEPGSSDQFINLIMFVVTAKEANSITCAGTSSSNSTSTGASTSSTSTSTSATPSTSTSGSKTSY